MEGEESDGVDGECDLDDANAAEGQASEAIGALAAVGVGVAVVGGVACSKTSVSTAKFETRETEQSRDPEHDFAGQQPILGHLQPRSPSLENVGLSLSPERGRDGGEEAMNLLRQEAVQRLETVKSSSTPLPPSISVARALSLSPAIPLFSMRALSLPLVEGKSDRGSFSTRRAAAGSPIPCSTWNKFGKSEDTFSTRQSPKYGEKTKLRKAQERMRKGRLDSKERIKRKAEEEQGDLAASEDEEEGFNPPEITQSRSRLENSGTKNKERAQKDNESAEDGTVPIRNTSGPRKEDHEKNCTDHEKMDVQVKKGSLKSEEDTDDACTQDSAQRESEEEMGACTRLQKDEEEGKQEEGTADQGECSNQACRVAFTRMPCQEDFQTGGRVKEEEEEEEEEEECSFKASAEEEEEEKEKEEGSFKAKAVNEEDDSEREQEEGDKETEEEEKELEKNVQVKGVLPVIEEGVLVKDTELDMGKKSMKSTGEELEIFFGCEHDCGFCGSKFEVATSKVSTIGSP